MGGASAPPENRSELDDSHLPQAFCWTKFGPESGTSPRLIFARKDLVCVSGYEFPCLGPLRDEARSLGCVRRFGRDQLNRNEGGRGSLRSSQMAVMVLQTMRLIARPLMSSPTTRIEVNQLCTTSSGSTGAVYSIPIASSRSRTELAGSSAATRSDGRCSNRVQQNTRSRRGLENVVPSYYTLTHVAS